ncbi:probable RNA-directed DNA polymerase from transposon X-element [Trichonephila clavipes]|nr:probable RNA-directed DNA polymerase from transposon X-element [Trichonephila clavipes]
MRDFIDKHASDIFLIQETPEHSFKIPNYSCYRNDRTHPNPGWGGTALLIKNCISHYHVPTPPQFTGVEMTLIMLTPIDHDPILIGSTYIPPVNEYFRNLNAALAPIFNSNNMTILVGDFNAKHTSWGCPVSDTRGNKLYHYIMNKNIDVLAPPTPTRFGTASATIIDYALMKNLNWPCNIDSIPELSSDHNPIKLHFPRTAKFEIPPPQLNTNWNLFTKTLANTENCHLPHATSTPEIESQVRELTSEILTAHAKASRPPIRSPICTGYFPNAWKTAVVIPILKPGKNPKLADSHRPISLLPILSKLAEKIISARLNDYLERNNILTPEQHGFRPRISTPLINYLE